MKKFISIILSVLITAMLMACSNNSQPQEEQPLANEIYRFESVAELENFLLDDSVRDSQGNVLKNDSDIERRCGAEFVKFKNAFVDGSNKLKVPYFTGVFGESKNNTEYERITVLSKELYGFSWIWYRFRIDDCYVIVKTAYMGEDFKETAEETAFPELLKQIYPDAPNVHNCSEEKWSHYKAIYGAEMCIGGKNTSALVCETRKDERVSVFFAYEDMIVVISGNDMILSDGFLDDLTFSAFT